MELYFVSLDGHKDGYFDFTFCDDSNKLYNVSICQDSFAAYLELEGVNWNHVFKKEPSLLTDNVEHLFERSQLEHTNYDVYINEKNQYCLNPL